MGGLSSGFTLPGRGIPSDGVAPQSKTAGMLPRPALSAVRRAPERLHSHLRDTPRVACVRYIWAPSGHVARCISP